MNALIGSKERMRIWIRSSKGFQMTHNGTRVSTGLFIELGVFGGAEILLRVLMKEPHRGSTFPKLFGGRTYAFDNPIVSSITLAVAGAVSRHFLLPRQDRFDAVRMQIAIGAQVRQAHHCATGNGLRQLARRDIVGVLFAIHVVIGGSEAPQGIVCTGIIVKGDNLLSTATPQRLFLRVQVVPRILVLDFDY
jgi:hypothetical protein